MDMFEPGFAGALAPFLFPAVRLARPYATRQCRLLAFSLAAGGGLGDAAGHRDAGGFGKTSRARHHDKFPRKINDKTRN
jgi:hypothetical protein